MRSRFDSRLMFGASRYIGWTLGNLFSLSYYSGKEFGRRNYPIANKAIGIVIRREQQSVVHYCTFRGLTDPFSLVLLFALTYLIFALADFPHPLGFTAAWVAAVALLTFICTVASAVGHEGKVQIDKFLQNYW